VKSAADAQAWKYGNLPPKFNIKETLGYDENTGYDKEKKYQADIYVLAPLDTNQWEFWFFTKDEIVSLLQGRQSISVSKLKTMKVSIGFHELAQINQI
jgi:hypothetical protein